MFINKELKEENFRVFSRKINRVSRANKNKFLNSRKLSPANKILSLKLSCKKNRSFG